MLRYFVFAVLFAGVLAQTVVFESPYSSTEWHMYIPGCVRFHYEGADSTADVYVVHASSGDSVKVAEDIPLTGSGYHVSLDVACSRISPGDVFVRLLTDGGSSHDSPTFSLIASAPAAWSIQTCAANAPKARCADLVTNADAWGMTATGVDLRAWTASTLHYIGCPGDGCNPGTFYCTDSDTTLEFGTSNSDNHALRAAVDVDNLRGDDWPTASDFNDECCTTSLGLCNSPDKETDAIALCNALGYSSGTVVVVDDNYCPEPHALDDSGLSWSSDFVDSNGFGKSYSCVI